MTVIRSLTTQGKSLIFAHCVGLFFIVFLKQNSAEFSVLVLWTNSVILISYKPLNIYHNPTKHKVKQTYFSRNIISGLKCNRPRAPQHVCMLSSIWRWLRVKAREASVKFFLRKQSPFPLGSQTEPEFVLRKLSRSKITEYKSRVLQDAACDNTCRSGERWNKSNTALCGLAAIYEFTETKPNIWDTGKWNVVLRYQLSVRILDYCYLNIKSCNVIYAYSLYL